MKSFRNLACVMILVFLAFPTVAAEETVVLFPQDLTLAKEGKVKVFAFRNAEGAIQVTVNGIGNGTLKGESLQSGQADLRPGLNLVEIGGKRIRVYCDPNVKGDRFRLLSENDDPPLVFQAYRIHPAMDDGCEGCHMVEGGKLKAKGQKEACYACHDNFEKGEGGKKYVHTPVAAGECTGCHDPHFSSRSKLQKLEKGCLECHDAPPAGASSHYPVSERQCTACHGPHNGVAPKQLVRNGNDLCLGCHRKLHTHHQSSAEVKFSESTRVPREMAREGDDMACLGCHLPHSSAERRLFRKSQGDLCKTCHLT